MATWWFVLILFMPDGVTQRHVHHGFSSLMVCEVVMRREVESAMVLVRRYKLRGVATERCEREVMWK